MIVVRCYFVVSFGFVYILCFCNVVCGGIVLCVFFDWKGEELRYRVFFLNIGRDK